MALIATVGAAKAPAQQPAAPRVPAMHFAESYLRAANGDSVAADTATLVVGENRDVANSRLIRIAVVRLRGTTASGRRAAPVIYVSGGSGAGISAATGARFPFFVALRSVGDVIVFDTRGAGRSAPILSCDARLDIDMSVPLTRDMLVRATRAVNASCASSLRARGFDLGGYNGKQIVEDIDAVRMALGVPSIRLFGISTGTHIALEYARRHGTHLSSVVLAGTEGPGMTAHLPSGMDATVMALDSTASPGIASLLRSVFAELDAKPVTVKVTDRSSGAVTDVLIGGYDARVFVASTLGDRSQMKMLAPLFAAMRAGQFAPVAGLKVQKLTAPFQSPLESLHDCQAGSAAERTAQVVREAPTALLGYATLDFAEACDGWGVKELDASFRTPVRSNVPALFISGTLDGRTPARNAEEVRAGFPKSSHFIVPGASHGDDLFLAAPAILETVLRFLDPVTGSK
jgi:pimeloyl-ACP methyl ester carboxylesterase